MSILSEDGIRSLAKAAANASQKRQNVYQASSGELLFGPDGTLLILKKQFGQRKSYTWLYVVYPDGQEPKE